jgi:SAM-dependent methyltransferase
MSEVWARSFGANATGYGEYRPPLPVAICSWLGVTADSHVVDVGAGTGQASRVLKATGAQVVAVEADTNRHQLVSAHADGTDARLGTAEELPVESDSTDLVLSVSAWHWFDQNRAFDEAARVLRQGGVLAIVWNGMDQTNPWGRAFMAATETTDNSVVPPELRPGPHAVRPPAGSPFVEIETLVLPWTWSRSVDQVLGLVATYSVFITGDSALRKRIVSAAEELLEGRIGENGLIDLPMAARCWKATKLTGLP